MSMLSALVSDDVPSNSNDGQGSPTQQSSENAGFDELLNGVTLEQTTLGDAVNTVKAHWNQLLSQVLSEAGNVQPTHDHVKELAEFTVKQLKESCLEATKEFHKVALEWQFNNPKQLLDEDISDLKEAVDRQNSILNTTEEKFADTLERYYKLSK